MEKLRIVKKQPIIIMISILILLLGGCNMQKTATFSSEKEAKQLLLKKLEKKYNQPFQIIGDEKYSYVGFHHIYTCDVAPEGKDNEPANARITDFGEMTDDYSKYSFKKKAEKIADTLLKDKPYIESYTVEFKAPWSKYALQKEKVSLAEYAEKTYAYNSLDVYFANGLSLDQYADQIRDLMDGLINETLSVELAVLANEECIFFEKFGVNDISKKTYDHQRILEVMESQLRSNRAAKFETSEQNSVSEEERGE